MRLRHVLPVLLLSSTTFALPPNAPKDLRPGANHHTGDDGFVAHQGREPKADEEKLRMHEHFVAVRARLAKGRATRPELAQKRDKLLAALDTYIANGTTPDNDHLPWRTPVFIDDQGTICAVGYLIEQSAGRPLADKIASSHRYSFIEDIAKDMPEVRDWVADSGFTLDELGQIQPGYMGPNATQFHGWNLVEDSYIEDGAYESGDKLLQGTIRDRKMEGVWVRRDGSGNLLGSGIFRHGKGAWTSYYPSGAKMAEGHYRNNVPTGEWRIYHESGNLAAEGKLERGARIGRWHFYYDTADKTAIATGKFSESGFYDGTWKHYDATGKLLATSDGDVVPDGWKHDPGTENLWGPTSFKLDIVPGADNIEHHMHAGSISGDEHRMDLLAKGDERVYLRYDSNDVFDETGHKLVEVDGGFRADDCGWSRAAKRAAKDGDVTRLHGLVWDAEKDKCTEGKLIPQARAERVAALVHSLDEVHKVSSDEVQQLALDQMSPRDLTRLVAANMSRDIEWPHIDGRFVAVYESLPGVDRRS